MAVTGVVREDPRAPGGVELTVTGLEVLGPSVGLPDLAQGARDRSSCSSTGTSGSAAGGRWRSRGSGTRWCRRSATSSTSADFVLVDTPILTGAIGEEAGNLFATDYFDLGKAYLAQTGQLYVEAAAAALGQGLLLRPDVPRREVEDAPPPDRVLDGRAGGGVQRLRTTTCGCRKSS